ncbi:hypothetical protein LINPERHAP2_LOCUS3987, partial [Linum perenne]
MFSCLIGKFRRNHTFRRNWIQVGFPLKSENEGNAISTWSDDDVDPPISVSRGLVE